MAFPWSKNERADFNPPPLPQTPAQAQTLGPAASEVPDLFRRLERLGEELGQANQQVAAYLLRREAQAAVAPATGPAAIAPVSPQADGAMSALRDKVEAMATRLDELTRHNAAMTEMVHQLQGQLDRGFQHLAEVLLTRTEQPIEQASAAASPAVSGDWERVILGAQLAADPALAFQRKQLIDGALTGDAGARALVGQMLLFHSAPPERLPQQLKEIGEAYYRWQPKTQPGTSPVEEALCAWLQRECEAAGLHNTIELVHPGERFDAARHTADSRGVEITEVRGWIVLRDNGKVYTKANVAVR